MRIHSICGFAAAVSDKQCS